MAHWSTWVCYVYYYIVGMHNKGEGGWSKTEAGFTLA